MTRLAKSERVARRLAERRRAAASVDALDAVAVGVIGPPRLFVYGTLRPGRPRWPHHDDVHR